ncbi:MAG: type II secretion system F family protein [Pseudomonadota bacterium]
MDTKFLIFIVFVFIAAFFALEALYYWWVKRFGAESTRLRNRIEHITNHDLDRNGYQGILKNRYAANQSVLNQFLFKLSLTKKLDALLLHSGELWTIAKFFKMTALSAFVAGFVCLLLNFNVAIVLLAALLAASLPLLYVLRSKNKRLAKFEEQLPEAIDTICRSLKAGHAFNSAFTLVGEELADPIATEFRITMEENNLGININEAMQNLAERVPLTDLKFFVVAVLIQRETGGNLAEILSNISNIIRERFKLRRQIGVMTAEGRLSAKILGAMPIIMLMIMSTLNPTYAPLMFNSPTGIYSLKVGAVMMLAGFIWMRSIINIKM